MDAYLYHDSGQHYDNTYILLPLTAFSHNEMELSHKHMVLNWCIKNALAGNRTQIYCLEGSNANHYTTNALLKYNITDEALVVYF